MRRLGMAVAAVFLWETQYFVVICCKSEANYSI